MGRKKSTPVAWLEVALQGEQRGEVWVVSLHLHGLQHSQNPASTRPEVAVVLRLHSLPSSAGSLQVWELAFLCGNIFFSSQELLSVFMHSGQSSPSRMSPYSLLQLV